MMQVRVLPGVPFRGAEHVGHAKALIRLSKRVRISPAPPLGCGITVYYMRL